MLRSPGQPAGYALLDGDAALLIDAPTDGAGLAEAGVKKIEGVLLTHYHRDSIAFAGKYLKDKISVRAPKAAAEWLTTANVKKYWQESLPLRVRATTYLVHPTGFDGIDSSLVDGQTITGAGGSLRSSMRRAMPWPMSRSSRKGNGPKVVFCGGALAPRESSGPPTRPIGTTGPTRG